MAAATGYGDAPTAEELLEYGDLPRQGRDMAEVFAVRVPAAAGGDRPPPCGSIFFHGGHSCSDLIYTRKPSGTDELAAPQPCDGEVRFSISAVFFLVPSLSSSEYFVQINTQIQGNLVLTGPSVAASAYGPVIFDLQLHDGSHHNNTTAGRIFCDTVSGEFSTYDKTISQTVTTGYGHAEVVYAVLSNAVEGRVAVKLSALPVGTGEGDHGAITGVLGRIIARSKLLDAGCVLFYSDGATGKEAGVSVRSGEMLPLARQVLAVRLHRLLTVELNLRSGSGEEIVRGAVDFNPASSGEHVERVVGMSGADVEVTVSWSDYPW
nr:unnamed protein product [Digitaria exilis]